MENEVFTMMLHCEPSVIVSVKFPQIYLIFFLLSCLLQRLVCCECTEHVVQKFHFTFVLRIYGFKKNEKDKI
jgi:hypothetical protein